MGVAKISERVFTKKRIMSNTRVYVPFFGHIFFRGYNHKMRDSMKKQDKV